MGKESIESRIKKTGIMLFQSIIVYFSAYIVSLSKCSEYNTQTIEILYILHFVAFYTGNMYYRFCERGFTDELFHTIKYNVVLVIAITFTSFMLKDVFSISRLGVIYFFCVNTILVYIADMVLKKYSDFILPYLRRDKRFFIITCKDRVENIYECLSSPNFYEGKPVGITVLDDMDCNRRDVRFIHSSQMFDFVTKEVVDEILIDLPIEDYNICGIISQFGNLGINVSVSLDITNFCTVREKMIREVGSFNVITYSTNFYRTSHVIAKRCIDIIGAIVGLFICALVGIVLMPLIRKDGGPAFFVQKRVGKNGRYFNIYKFRSMCVDAEDIKKELMEYNTMSGNMFKMKDDPRVTKIGHFIRRTSLDELPQFYNVLTGDMSLVGTRPPTVDEYQDYTLEQKRRLTFKPGITGLWQVSGRNEITDFDEVVKLDIAYIDNWTIWTDIKILLKTVKVVLKKDGAM